MDYTQPQRPIDPKQIEPQFTFQEKKKKFEVLQEKLNNLVKEEFNHRVLKVEKKVDTNKKSISAVSESLTTKYQMLTQYCQKLRNILEEEKHKKALLRDVMIQNVRLLYKKVLNKVSENNENLKNKALEYVKTLETRVNELSIYYEQDKDSLGGVMEEIKNIVSTDIESLNEKFNNEVQERSNNVLNISAMTNDLSLQIKDDLVKNQSARENNETAFSNQFGAIIENSSKLFSEEVKKRQKFEENIFALLKETQQNMSNKFG
mmetsp:Transcript_10432/g.10796  ORF Transcript_10432/g.10796 Transcript_10432/m.10796 type:complete len:262 (-) Transcript_10432:45-830(-)